VKLPLMKGLYLKNGWWIELSIKVSNLMYSRKQRYLLLNRKDMSKYQA